MHVRENSKQRDLEKYEARRDIKNCDGAKWTSGGPLYPAIFVRLKSSFGVFQAKLRHFANIKDESRQHKSFS